MSEHETGPRPVTPAQNANAEKSYTVTRAQLPLHCPTAEMSLWNSHPRVYLPIEDTGKETCPYCGAVYTLTEPGQS